MYGYVVVLRSIVTAIFRINNLYRMKILIYPFFGPIFGARLDLPRNEDDITIPNDTFSGCIPTLGSSPQCLSKLALWGTETPLAVKVTEAWNPVQGVRYLVWNRAHGDVSAHELHLCAGVGLGGGLHGLLDTADRPVFFVEASNDLD